MTIKRYMKVGFSFQIKVPETCFHLDNLLTTSKGFYTLKIKHPISYTVLDNSGTEEDNSLHLLRGL